MAEPNNNTFNSSANDVTNGKKIYGAYDQRNQERLAHVEASKHGNSSTDNFGEYQTSMSADEPMTDFSSDSKSDYNWIDGSEEKPTEALSMTFDFGEFVDEDAEDLKKRSWTQPTGTGAEKFHLGELPRTREEFEASGGYGSEPVNEKVKSEFETKKAEAEAVTNKLSDTAQDIVKSIDPRDIYSKILGTKGDDTAEGSYDPDTNTINVNGETFSVDDDGTIVGSNGYTYDDDGNPLTFKGRELTTNEKASLSSSIGIKKDWVALLKGDKDESTTEPSESAKEEPTTIETPKAVEEPKSSRLGDVTKLLESGSDEEIVKAVEENPEEVVKAVIKSDNAKYAGTVRTDRDYGTEHTNKTRAEMYSERLQHLKETLGSNAFSLKDKVKEVTTLIRDLRDITLNGDLSQKERQAADVIEKVFDAVGSVAGPVGSVIADVMATAIRLLLGMDAGPYIQKYYVGNYRQGAGSQNGGVASISNDARDQLNDSFNPNDVGQSHGNYNKGLTKESDEKVKGYIRTVVRGQPHVRNLANKLRK